MPELPEVETTRRGIEPHVRGRCVAALQVRDGRLRWPVPEAELRRHLVGQRLQAVRRRAKYLLLDSAGGSALIHLGMSGSLRVIPASTTAQLHDHVDLVLDDGMALRLRDPRRFGALLWAGTDPLSDPRLVHLGPEPLDAQAFDGSYLYRISRGRRQAVKNLLMDSRAVVGVGNIYANEALFQAGIRPGTAAGRLSKIACTRLVDAVRQVLLEAIAAGGTTLRDFLDSQGRPGFFAQQLQVYGRAGEPCMRCANVVRRKLLGQRATYYCPRCQR